VLPDAADDFVPASAGAGVGQLTAASIREVWPEIIATVGRQSKKLAALASGATVRDLDGETLVLTFRFPAHAKMVAAEPDLIANALYEALGGRWEIRCEVAGEAGAVQVAPGGPAPRGAPTQKKAPRSAPPSPAETAQVTTAASRRPREAARQRQADAQSTSGGGDDDWPEPARLGGMLAAPNLDDQPDRVDAQAAIGGVALEAAPGPASPSRNSRPTSDGAPAVASDAGRAAGGGRNGGPTSDGGPAAASVAGRTAASAAAAGGRNAVTARQATSRPVAAPADTGASDWPDGAGAEEPPYDPDYDGPVRATPVAYEGFDPGDEPLDEVMDENTARQSSEQQAMQLLQEALGAEKIGES
jgi:DNA polymerase III subunit gamma/tau